MNKFKIGQEIIIDEDHTIQSLLTNKITWVREGDKGFIDSNGYIHYTTGDARGKIAPYTTKENLQGYVTQNIASMIYKKLDTEFEISALADLYDDVEKQDVLDILEDALIEIF